MTDKWDSEAEQVNRLTTEVLEVFRKAQTQPFIAIVALIRAISLVISASPGENRWGLIQMCKEYIPAYVQGAHDSGNGGKDDKGTKNSN